MKKYKGFYIPEVSKVSKVQIFACGNALKSGTCGEIDCFECLFSMDDSSSEYEEWYNKQQGKEHDD